MAYIVYIYIYTIWFRPWKLLRFNSDLDWLNAGSYKLINDELMHYTCDTCCSKPPR